MAEAKGLNYDKQKKLITICMTIGLLFSPITMADDNRGLEIAKHRKAKDKAGVIQFLPWKWF